MQNLKNTIDNQIKNIEDNCDEKTLSKINETKDFLEETDEKTTRKLNKIKELSESNKIGKKTANKTAEKIINDTIKKYNKKNKNLSIYQKVLQALEEKVDIESWKINRFNRWNIQYSNDSFNFQHFYTTSRNNNHCSQFYNFFIFHDSKYWNNFGKFYFTFFILGISS